MEDLTREELLAYLWEREPGAPDRFEAFEAMEQATSDQALRQRATNLHATLQREGVTPRRIPCNGTTFAQLPSGKLVVISRSFTERGPTLFVFYADGSRQMLRGGFAVRTDLASIQDPTLPALREVYERLTLAELGPDLGHGRLPELAGGCAPTPTPGSTVRLYACPKDGGCGALAGEPCDDPPEAGYHAARYFAAGQNPPTFRGGP